MKPEAESGSTPIRVATEGRYLTDGSRLYRVLGYLDDDDLMALEDCATLVVLLMEPERVGRLRHVEVDP
jgi:hypothetical protein